MFAFAAGGVFSASQVLAEELYKLCGESGGDGARFSRLCRNNSHRRKNNSASFAGCLNVSFVFYNIILPLCCQRILIFAKSFFQKIYLLLSKTLLTMRPSVFMKDKKTFFVSELITRLTVTDQS